MKYKALVQQIREVPWQTYDPKTIIYLSWVTALEFAESLRDALEAYPNNSNLKEMALGELNTNNLSYAEYSKTGDHCEFLEHFIGTNNILRTLNKSILSAKKTYWKEVENLGLNVERAMTIFSREQELPDIFKNILAAHDWDALGFGFYKYYLERHIALDSEDGGHAELTKDFELDEEILEKFYTLRLNLYKSLEN